jgi:TonB family protein
MRHAFLVLFLLLNLNTQVQAQSPICDKYLAEVHSRLNKAWFPPKGLESGIIVVRFKINREGRVSSSDINIEKSSGSNMADQAALAAVQNGAPFEKLPNEFPDPLETRMTFDYKALLAEKRARGAANVGGKASDSSRIVPGVNKAGAVRTNNLASFEQWFSNLTIVLSFVLMIWGARSKNGKLITCGGWLLLFGWAAPALFNWLIASARDAGWWQLPF